MFQRGELRRSIPSSRCGTSDKNRDHQLAFASPKSSLLEPPCSAMIPQGLRAASASVPFLGSPCRISR